MLILNLDILASFALITVLARQRLQTTERVVHELQRLIHVVHGHFVAEVQLGQGLRDANNAEKHTWCHIHIALVRRVLSLELSLFNVLSNDVVVEGRWDGWVERLGVRDECSHDIGVNSLMGHLLSSWSNLVLMHGRYVLSQLLVLGLIGFVKQKEDHIETREKSLW